MKCIIIYCNEFNYNMLVRKETSSITSRTSSRFYCISINNLVSVVVLVVEIVVEVAVVQIEIVGIVSDRQPQIFPLRVETDS